MIRLILTATVALTLSGCITKPVPVTPTPVQMPALPAPLNQRAQDLPPLVATDLHGMIRESMATDRAYNEVRDRLNTVLDVYDCVRTAMNSGSDAKACFREAGQ
ncbi:hypothetical protein [Brevundimonas sp. NPDC058933]|uniref:hypothetical protein n=1 Tax=Brevundimonas sp. NPDC058933 TaxID=3346673 RepID=UPI003BEEF972